ncbi:DUF1893 domain-containing protein [candidate division KSB1 bacterium]|nr:DUF1893 domain-containing protein [candidate division KSB1 bacterium]
MNVMQHALEVYYCDSLIFSSDGKWLHPLLELKMFLDGQQYDVRYIEIRDKIIGKAAAMIIVHIGAASCYGEIISKRGLEVLDKHRVRYNYKTQVDRIQCKTEDMLEKISDPQEAYDLIADLAGLAAKSDLS